MTSDRGAEPVYKVTLFMTPAQWEALSAWSVPRMGGSDPVLGPWLRLIHDGDQRAEYEERVRQEANWVVLDTIYQTSP